MPKELQGMDAEEDTRDKDGKREARVCSGKIGIVAQLYHIPQRNTMLRVYFYIPAAIECAS